MARQKPISTTAKNGTDLTARKGHATHRELRGRDRRAEKRTERESLIVVLMPSLFERLTEAA